MQDTSAAIKLIKNIDTYIKDRDLINDAILEVTMEEVNNGGDKSEIMYGFIKLITNKIIGYKRIVRLSPLPNISTNTIYNTIKDECKRRSIV